ncbi:hypothetical protein ERW51_16095 [Aliivibrio finisterrensis]|uniref:nitroreductase family protein n=1 Tax=Aliivibrio finisterrensis TaxID=511998 RepID=UPI00101E8A46|nr:nitroreductase family protein [Aliivibrio finisterrensis]RYU65236.1 hypothetical protein ERW54_16805 [Aliivibrio finisterrensis]RYU68610.1 hypothetical protein ERW51_16095 [Aliivibrio finisterrensis]RYU71999.1 hypothetical protein ERW48_16295 [Aliivibrio finisterrensis]
MKAIKKIIKKILARVGVIKIMPTEDPHLYSSFSPYVAIDKLSDNELLSLMRHEAHRIEKSIYNDIFEKKYEVYFEKAKRLDSIFAVFDERNIFSSDNTVAWAKDIRSSFDNLLDGFIQPNSSKTNDYNFSLMDNYLSHTKSRRSVRVWKNEQLDKLEWLAVANTMIECAKWAPCSGNRQPWRFKVIIEKEDKQLLKGVKEEHCTSAPLLIFIGMDRRVYGALSKTDYETALFVDAGAAIMNMIAGAHDAGLGTCWNHFGRDLITSRKVNQEIYNNFCNVLNIDKYIEPVAILAVGLPDYIPPTPERMVIEQLII